MPRNTPIAELWAEHQRWAPKLNDRDDADHLGIHLCEIRDAIMKAPSTSKADVMIKVEVCRWEAECAERACGMREYDVGYVDRLLDDVAAIVKCIPQRRLNARLAPSGGSGV
jgi:hypothetical protein